MGLTILGLLAACTPAQKTASPAQPQAQSQRVYFPPAPAPPRIQFLMSLNRGTALALAAKEKTSFAKWVVGEEKTGKQPSDHIDTPYGVDAYNGKIYVCDVGADVVHIIDAAASRYATLGAKGMMKNPVNITIDRRDGTKYVCDSEGRQVYVFDEQDRFVRSFGDVNKLMPMDLAIDGEELYIADMIGGEVEVWSRDGRFLRAFSRKGEGVDELDQPTNLALGPDGRVYVTDTMGQQVKMFSKAGQFLGTIGAPGDKPGNFARPKGIAVDPHGYIYVVDAQWKVAQIFSSDDRLLLIISSLGGAAPGLLLPAGIAIDHTSLPYFTKYLDPDFQPEYLVFLINQYGPNKLAVYAFGRSKSAPAGAYE